MSMPSKKNEWVTASWKNEIKNLRDSLDNLHDKTTQTGETVKKMSKQKVTENKTKVWQKLYVGSKKIWGQSR